jgi:hypothetical protein
MSESDSIYENPQLKVVKNLDAGGIIIINSLKINPLLKELT